MQSSQIHACFLLEVLSLVFRQPRDSRETSLLSACQVTSEALEGPPGMLAACSFWNQEASGPGSVCNWVSLAKSLGFCEFGSHHLNNRHDEIR